MSLKPEIMMNMGNNNSNHTRYATNNIPSIQFSPFVPHPMHLQMPQLPTHVIG